MPDTSSSSIAFIRGQLTTENFATAYTVGGDSVLSDTVGFLSGNIFVEDTMPCFLAGVVSLTGSNYAYTDGILRSSFAGYLEGSPQIGEGAVSNNYIVLETSDASFNKKFKVISGDYDDGTPDKAGTARRTIGGGISYSVGAVYNSWRPTIRVRQVENESGFGDLSDLQYFYSLNNPNGVPSNLITFVDHHGISRVVVMPGSFKKQVLTTAIEGTEAIYIVQLNFQEIPNA